MLKKIIGSSLALLLIMGTAACGGAGATPGSDTQNGGTSSAGLDEEVIRIGYVSALTGDTALWGQAGLNGMEMAVEDINAAGGVLGGRRLEVVGLDGRGEPLDSVNALNRLIDQENVVAVVGTNFSSCNIAMAPVADEKGIPLIATAASSPLVTVDEDGNLHPYSFRIGFIDPFQGRVLAAYAVDSLNLTRAAILTDIGDSYSTGITDYLVEEYTSRGGEIVAREEARSGDNDFRAQLSNIRAADPEVLFIPWIYRDVALITRQARELGIEAVFVGADGWDSQDLPELAGSAAEEAYFCSRPSFNTEEAIAFGERYEARYSITPEAECLFGYDAVTWLVQVMEAAGSAEPDAIRDGLESTTSFDGYLGHMSIDAATHNPTRDAAIFRIEEGEVVYLENFSVR